MSVFAQHVASTIVFFHSRVIILWTSDGASIRSKDLVVLSSVLPCFIGFKGGCS